jgi:hypothetical protein
VLKSIHEHASTHHISNIKSPAAAKRKGRLSVGTISSFKHRFHRRGSRSNSAITVGIGGANIMNSTSSSRKTDIVHSPTSRRGGVLNKAKTFSRQLDMVLQDQGVLPSGDVRDEGFKSSRDTVVRASSEYGGSMIKHVSGKGIGWHFIGCDYQDTQTACRISRQILLCGFSVSSAWFSVYGYYEIAPFAD